MKKKTYMPHHLVLEVSYEELKSPGFNLYTFVRNKITESCRKTSKRLIEKLY